MLRRDLVNEKREIHVPDSDTIYKNYYYDGPFDLTFSRVDDSNIPNLLTTMAYYGSVDMTGKILLH